MIDLGIRQLGSTIDFKFNTVDKTTPGLPITLAGSPAIKIYRSNDTTTEQTTGLTLTTDFDGVTGMHHVNIVTTSSAFYTLDTDFEVMISAGTVDSVSVVGAVLARFRLHAVSVDGALDSGTAAAIANGTITLRSGHGLATIGSALVVLTAGTQAVGKSRLITYSGSGDVFNVDPAWNVAGESLPSGTITYRVYGAPPAPTSTVPAVNSTQIGGTTQTAGDVYGLFTAAYAEPVGITGSTASLADRLAFIGMIARNKLVEDKGAQTMTLYANNGTSVIATWSTAVAGSQVTRGKGA